MSFQFFAVAIGILAAIGDLKTIRLEWHRDCNSASVPRK
jgi:hypothetical protein